MVPGFDDAIAQQRELLVQRNIYFHLLVFDVFDNTQGQPTGQINLAAVEIGLAVAGVGDRCLPSVSIRTAQ